MTLRWYFRECQYGRQFGDECYASIGSNGEQTLPQREARDGTLTAETSICDVHDSSIFQKNDTYNLFLAHTINEEGREAGGGHKGKGGKHHHTTQESYVLSSLFGCCGCVVVLSAVAILLRFRLALLFWLVVLSLLPCWWCGLLHSPLDGGWW